MLLPVQLHLDELLFPVLSQEVLDVSQCPAPRPGPLGTKIVYLRAGHASLQLPPFVEIEDSGDETQVEEALREYGHAKPFATGPMKTMSALPTTGIQFQGSSTMSMVQIRVWTQRLRSFTRVDKAFLINMPTWRCYTVWVISKSRFFGTENAGKAFAVYVLFLNSLHWPRISRRGRPRLGLAGKWRWKIPNQRFVVRRFLMPVDLAD